VLPLKAAHSSLVLLEIWWCNWSPDICRPSADITVHTTMLVANIGSNACSLELI